MRIGFIRKIFMGEVQATIHLIYYQAFISHYMVYARGYVHAYASREYIVACNHNNINS